MVERSLSQMDCAQLVAGSVDTVSHALLQSSKVCSHDREVADGLFADVAFMIPPICCLEPRGIVAGVAGVVKYLRNRQWSVLPLERSLERRRREAAEFPRRDRHLFRKYPTRQTGARTHTVEGTIGQEIRMPFEPRPHNCLATEDRELARSALAGEATARSEIIRRLSPVRAMLISAARRRHQYLNSSDLDDLAQQVSLTAWRRLASFEGRARLESWVYRICTLELKGYVRREERRRRAMRDWHSQNADRTRNLDVVDAFEDLRGDGCHLRRALYDLGSPRAEIVLMRHVHGLTFKAIAGQVGVPHNTVRSHYYRGLIWLRRTLTRKDVP